ncbi:hypothetical protein chiPu_0022162, partial [Chiloscyllium punctatum]|nr:hypothetical protein [Chiloscyllium punctatum]
MVCELCTMSDISLSRYLFYPSALKDERFQLVSFTQKQLRIALSDIRVRDEGGYYCQLYSEDTHHQVAVVTVL